LKAGDLVSLDFGLVYGGYYADTAFSMLLPPFDSASERLVKATEEALFIGIDKARIGLRVGDIGHAIEQHVRPKGFGVVTQMVGHGIGRKLHEAPSVPNHGKKGTGDPIKPGMVLAIEPMITLGGDKTKTLKDEWTVVTADDSRSAHFEHTVAITPAGPEILTRLD
jgi:methionyl aminopeptidase